MKENAKKFVSANSTANFSVLHSVVLNKNDKNAQPGANMSVFIGADHEMINKYPRMNPLDIKFQNVKVWLHKPNKNNFTPVSAFAFQIKKKHVETEPLT